MKRANKISGRRNMAGKTHHAPRSKCKQEWLEHLDPKEVFEECEEFAQEESQECFTDLGQHFGFQ